MQADGSLETVAANRLRNGDLVRVRVTATGSETALAGIMRLVEEAQRSKSKTQVLADKAAGWLFYIALRVAILTAIAWTLATGFNVYVIERVATVLVIACPHALGLAIPLVVAITTAMGANNGILVRNRLALEEARQIDTVIFEKTGTLTKGEFGVVGMAVAEGWEENQALALTAAIEGDSEHTIARGLRQSAEKRGLALPEVSDFEAIKGRGVRASWQGREATIGGPRLLESLSLSLPEPLAGSERTASAKGQSVVQLGDSPLPGHGRGADVGEHDYRGHQRPAPAGAASGELSSNDFKLGMGGEHAGPDHIRLLLDCAEICQTSANFMLRISGVVR